MFLNLIVLFCVCFPSLIGLMIIRYRLVNLYLCPSNLFSMSRTNDKQNPDRQSTDTHIYMIMMCLLMK